MSDKKRKKIALWHRYGPAGHVRCGGQAIPLVVSKLAKHCEVHYFGTRAEAPTPQAILDHATIHDLPFTVNRASTRDKIFKTLLWYLAMPLVALKCRFMGIDAVFVDETLPLCALIVRIFYGKKVAMTIADFFLAIYFGKAVFLKPVCRLIQAIDFSVWRGLPVIFTKVDFTRTFLGEKGFETARIHPVYNPCDTSVYFPRDKRSARERYNLKDSDLVIVHHGILHPNKGNDRIFRALADVRDKIPNVKYLLVGSGPEQGRLEKLRDQLGIQDVVVFTGWLPTEEDVNWGLNAADIGLVMRIGQFSDNFHVTDTLVHEMACGLPVIAANLAGIAEVITDGETGFLFDPDNMKEFKSKLLKLIEDRSLREKFGKAALAICKEKFNLDAVSDQTAGPLLTLAGVERVTTPA